MASTPQNRKPDDDSPITLGPQSRTQEPMPHVRKPSKPAMCANCQLPFTAQRPPVLLKSGRSVHVDCYFLLQKVAGRTAN